MICSNASNPSVAVLVTNADKLGDFVSLTDVPVFCNASPTEENQSGDGRFLVLQVARKQVFQLSNII